MLTLSTGLLKPEDGDKGSAFFDALEEAIQRLNDHTHNGSDGQKIAANDLTKQTSSISSANWVAVSGKTGLYSQTISLPGALTLGTIGIFFIDASTGHFYNLTVEKVSSTSYKVYINDNSVSLTAIYV